jgi:hypothetical protein
MTVLLPRDRRRSRYLFEYSPTYCLERAVEEAISGQAATFTRASVASVIGSDGVLHRVAHSQPRYQWFDLDGDGARETPCRLLEDTRTNLCLQSENFGTTWSAVGSPTRTAAAHTASGVSLDLIGDDAAGAVEYYGQNIAFTGNAAKAVSVRVRKGTSPAASGAVVALVDITAGTARLSATVTWSGDVPSVAASAGTYLGYEVLADGVYRLLFATTTVTAANTNEVSVRPAGVANSETGNIYAGGVQCENALFPSSYIKTTTATVTRAAEALTLPFMAAPRAMTIYAKFVERGTASTGGTNGVLGIGASTNAALFLFNESGLYKITHRRASDVASAAASTPSLGQVCELRGLLNGDGSVQLGQSIAGAAEVVASASGANALAAAWFDTTLTINSRFAGDAGFIAIGAIRIAAGVQTLAYMRGGG